MTNLEIESKIKDIEGEFESIKKTSDQAVQKQQQCQARLLELKGKHELLKEMLNTPVPTEPEPEPEAKAEVKVETTTTEEVK